MCLAGSLPIAPSPVFPANRGLVPLSSHLTSTPIASPMVHGVASSGSPGL